MDGFEPPGDCPVCGEFVAAGRKSCAHCGSDARSGWSDETRYDGLDLPESAFGPEDSNGEKSGRKWPALFWWLVGLVLIAVLIRALV